MNWPGTDAGGDAGTEAAQLRAALAQRLTAEGDLAEPAWRRAVEVVPRHRFVPGFYLPREEQPRDGLTVWEPVTAGTGRSRWLHSAYSDQTLITQFDGEEPDWQRPAPRAGGAPTSSSTLPSLVVRMWQDAEVADGQAVLEIGTGSGYSTALACERLGSSAVASVEIDPQRLAQAADSLSACGYAPAIAAADGLYGYWPRAPFDRIVAACSVRAIPAAWLSQTGPGGKILTTLSGWLYGYSRVLLTVHSDGTASGPLLAGTVSFMPARTHAPPAFGNPAHWRSMATQPAATRPARHAPQRITGETGQSFFARFLAQLAAPNAQLTSDGGAEQFIDVTTGSTATLTHAGRGWQVRQSGPDRLWDAIEAALDAWDHAGQPGPQEFRMHIGPQQQIRHPTAPGLSFTLP